jgi:long-chain acyl-CoA synthetase
MNTRTILLTGSTGLLGGRVLSRILGDHPDLHAYVLVRDPYRWRSTARAFRFPRDRVTPLRGDLGAPGVGLEREELRALTREHAAIVHVGADNEPTRDLEAARSTNVVGTRHLLELAADGNARFCLVSSAFVAGSRGGSIPEFEGRGRGAGWMNAWEQSKWEAEQVVRDSGLDYVILRPSAVVCDDLTGRVTRSHAFHLALRLIHAGLVPLLPGRPESPIDVVTADHAASAIASLAFHPDAGGATLHLCAGSGAANLADIVDWSWDVWATDPAWRKRSIAPPAFTDLTTWRLFEAAVEETGDIRLGHITGALTSLAPRLALETRFDTVRAEALLGGAAPPVASFWRSMVADVTRTQSYRLLDTAA